MRICESGSFEVEGRGLWERVDERIVILSAAKDLLIAISPCTIEIATIQAKPWG
jgi:hypothetical protein